MQLKIESPFTGPSGRVLSPAQLKLLQKLEHNQTIAWSDSEVKFNSGFLSHVYFRARNDLSHNIPLLMEVAAHAKTFVTGLDNTHGAQKCLIGIPTAGTQFAQAIADLSYFENSKDGFLSGCANMGICFSTMRSVLKDHGKDNMWVGPPQLEKYSYITFENVVSTAKAMLESFKRLEADGYPAHDMHHVVLADWGLGGMEALTEAGYSKIHALFTMQDVMAAYVHIGLWPKERYEEMLRRINEWNKSQKIS